MKIKNQTDFWAGIMFIGIGIPFALGALGYRMGSSVAPGPGYFPFGLGIILTLLGLIISFNAMGEGKDAYSDMEGIAWRPLLVILGSACLFAFTLPVLGLLIAMPLLTITSSLASTDFKWKIALWAAVAMTAFCWLVFSRFLGLLIPLFPNF
jgi:Tripartite tricarboxylate transporter TctB family